MLKYSRHVLYLQFFNNLLYICLIEEKRCVALLWVLLNQLLNFTLSYKIFICISLVIFELLQQSDSYGSCVLKRLNTQL